MIDFMTLTKLANGHFLLVIGRAVTQADDPAAAAAAVVGELV